ncbi:hypothetical protein MJO28_009662 [Puccinia striiformis f. sp. tritici]|uniref:Uncharacterized protein n=1 Tax=Puccinia striiformis f. sp. tritici TaxID=168172 RepID=A0ACC0EAZ7_9BASI|nr:hypothetical protein MJO28_009662 [Puccinia striiformis f. sp. tritici]
MSDPDIDQLLEKPHLPDIPETQLLRHQAALVIQGFNRLAEYEFNLPNTPADLSIDRLRSQKDLLTQLHTSLLPLLHHQITTISQALDYSELRQDTASKLALMLEIQPQIAHTVDQVIRAFNDIIAGRVLEPFPTNDQHFEEFKFFRLHGADFSIREDYIVHLPTLWENSCRVIDELQLPVPERKILSAIAYKSYILKRAINHTISLLGASELSILWDRWLDGLADIDTALTELSTLSNPRPDDTISTSQDTTSTSQGERKVLSKQAIQLINSFIPIAKLSRLFFVKLFREGMNSKQVPLSTDMSSHQMDFLDTSACNIGECFTDMLYQLEDSDIDPRPGTSRYLIGEIEKLTPLFQSYLVLVVLYIVPLYPDINGLSSQIYFRDWFVSWNTSFSVATHNAIQAVHFFERDGP